MQGRGTKTLILIGIVACLAILSFAAFRVSEITPTVTAAGPQDTDSGKSHMPMENAKASQGEGKGVYRGLAPITRFDESPALRDMKPITDNKNTKAENDERDIIPRVPVVPKEWAEDDVAAQRFTGDHEIPSPTVSFDGPPNNCGGCAPPDPNGEVGANHIIVSDNAQFQIFNKTGTSVFGPANINTLFTGFGGACETQNAGDPVVLYDQFADRWLITQFTSSGTTFFNCLAVSTTPNPTGTYYRYAISTGANFPDYPKWGVWHDAYYVSTREFLGTSGPFQGVGAYAINKAQILAGNPAATVVSMLAASATNPAYTLGDGLLPSDADGPIPPPAGSPNYFVGSQDNNGTYGAPTDGLTLWKFTPNFSTPAASTFTLANTIPITAYNSILGACGGTRSCIQQSGTTNRLDHLGYRQRPLFRLAYRNFGTHESLVTNQSVTGGTGPSGEVSGIRWWEIRSPNSNPAIYQEGTYAPGLTDGISRWMGSIAMDGSGNMGLGYSVSSSTMFPGVRYTGRLSNDPLGQMPQGEGVIVEGTGAQTGGGNRWGDYSAISVDPVDDCTFWYVNEYIPTTSAAGWRLRVGNFRFPTCGGPSGTLSGVVTSCATMAPISGASVTLSPNGYTTLSNATGNYALGVPVGNYTATASAAGYSSGPGATSNVVIVDGQTTTANYCLTPAATITRGTPAVTSGNALIEPSECNQVNIPVTNTGAGTATAVKGVLSTTTPNVTITQPNSFYPDIAPGATQTNNVPYYISTNGAVACFTSIDLKLTVTMTGGTSPQTFNFTMPVGQAANPNYTYTATTGNTIPGTPATATLVAASQADDAIATVVAPFGFTMYGNAVPAGNTLSLSTNGNIQFVSSGGASGYGNTALPSTAPNLGTGTFSTTQPTLFPYWDDLIMTTARSPLAGIYQQTIGVAPNRQWVLEWRAQNYNGGTAESGITVNFAVVFNENSDSYYYVYQTMSGVNPGGGSATIGDQAKSSGTQFTQYSFNTASVQAGSKLTAARIAGSCAAGSGACATAANASVEGRVVTSEGRGVTNAVVNITDSSGVTRSVVTGRNGMFVFGDVETGRTYVISVSSKRFHFTPKVIEVSDNISGLIFTPAQ